MKVWKSISIPWLLLLISHSANADGIFLHESFKPRVNECRRMLDDFLPGRGHEISVAGHKLDARISASTLYKTMSTPNGDVTMIYTPPQDGFARVQKVYLLQQKTGHQFEVLLPSTRARKIVDVAPAMNGQYVVIKTKTERVSKTRKLSNDQKNKEQYFNEYPRSYVVNLNTEKVIRIDRDLVAINPQNQMALAYSQVLDWTILSGIDVVTGKDKWTTTGPPLRTLIVETLRFDDINTLEFDYEDYLHINRHGLLSLLDGELTSINH